MGRRGRSPAAVYTLPQGTAPTDLRVVVTGRDGTQLALFAKEGKSTDAELKAAATACTGERMSAPPGPKLRFGKPFPLVKDGQRVGSVTVAEPVVTNVISDSTTTNSMDYELKIVSTGGVLLSTSDLVVTDRKGRRCGASGGVPLKQVPPGETSTWSLTTTVPKEWKGDPVVRFNSDDYGDASWR